MGKLAQLPVQAVPLLLEVAADLSLEPSEITINETKGNHWRVALYFTYLGLDALFAAPADP